jgi:hypothetical protein
MGTTQVYKIHYHFEFNGKKSSPEYIDYVSVASADYNSIKTVLSNNGKLLGSGTLQITAVQAHPSGSGTILT